MDRNEFVRSIEGAPPAAQDMVYVERRGQDYGWRVLARDDWTPPSEGADVWMYFTGDWPADDPGRLAAFCDDLLAELESMAGGADRCRWPLDQPWPTMH